MARAYGSNATLLLKKQSAAGVRATGNFYKMPFGSSSLGSEQGLIDDVLLGNGRDPQQPIQDVINDEGEIGIPVDARYLGLWLAGIFGVPTSAASAAFGTIAFTANPSVNDTITMNGVTYTFISGASSGTNIQIKASAALTVAEVVSVLNASASGSITPATYSNPSGAILLATYDTTGAGGNAYTLAVSAPSRAKVSGATLHGGGYSHIFSSGGTSLPVYTLQTGHPEVPAYFVHDDVFFNSIGFNFERSGAASATIGAIATGETRFASSQGGTPQTLTLSRFSQFNGSIVNAGAPVGNLTAANCTYTNNGEKIETIRSDGKIEGVDPTVAAFTGSMDVRFADTTFIDSAAAGTPVDLQFSYWATAALGLLINVPTVYLPKPKLAVTGPGGVQASYDFKGSYDSTLGKMLTVTLYNDLDGTQYA